MKRTTVLILLVVLASVFSCKMVDQVAPGGSTIFLTAQPLEINANGVSTLTVTGTRATGAPLPDGTVIRFTVDNAGSVSPNPVETRDGVAVSQFYAASFSGTVKVTATSGSAGGGTGNSNAVSIVVGDARAVNILVSADPPTLPFGGGTSQIRAVVTDKNGNRLPGIGVQFSVTAGPGTLHSGGRIINTNQSGVALDTLSTTETSTVTVTALNNTAKGEVTVTVGTTPLTVTFQFSPTEPFVGDVVRFVDTTVDPGGTIRSWHWNFGDGTTGSGKTVSHTYRTVGTFNVILTVTDSFGNSFTGQNPVTVVKPSGIQCQFSISPDSPNVGQVVSFNGSESTSTNGNINSYKWDFGDASALGTGVITTHVYDAEATYLVTLSLKDSVGATASCSQPVSVGCPLVTFSALPDGKVTNVYNATIILTPSGNYTFEKTGGTLPPGLSLSNSGVLAGTPTTAGIYDFVVTATPIGGGCVVSNSYEVEIVP